uniref:Uncharacterized protein n=1 Tax=Plectus sambesii TaxID=2011161 RepID=A0A914VM14_9BILA
MLRVAVARSVLRLRPSNVMCFCSVPSEAGKEPPKEKPKFNYKTLDQYKSEGGHS